ncbi:amidase [Spirosoma aerolatum]|uniref:amidase n=1 Tax=Spirosoma aerolatum TaxID=1211326 RepID=UPI0009AC4ADA|nr:amidase [Spirosoma aerolatum]
MSQYIYQSATELAAMIREGKASSVAIVQAHLDQIKKHNHTINALISIFEEEALQEAFQCDLEAQEGRFRGPLHGVPVTIKEMFWIKGKSSNLNSRILKFFVAPADAVIVDRIKKSGAIILGQTNVPRYILDYQVNGDIYPEGKNPYNTEYTPGGSTGGGAAALASGFTPLELGGDFGGSARVPSNFCGLYGLKPTDKTVPLFGNWPLPKNAKSFIIHMFQGSPLARTVDDLELLWKVIVGPHESDRTIPDISWKPSVKQSLREYRIAWADGWPGHEASAQIQKAVQSVADTLVSQGAKVEKKIPDETLYNESLSTFAGLFPYVIAQYMPWILRQLFKWSLLLGILKGVKKESPELVKAMKKAFRMKARHYGEMLFQKSQITERWEHFFEAYDFLICPVAYGPAYKRCKLGSRITYDGKEMIYNNYVWPYVAGFSATGHPCLTIPLGLGKEGLPIGVQVVGKYWSEPELIQFGKLISPLTKGFVKPEGY